MRNAQGEKEIKKWKPTAIDFAYGRMLMDAEDYSKVASTYRSEDNDILICGLIYSILSRREGFKLNREQFHAILDGNLDTPKRILENPKKLENTLKKYSLYEDKVRGIKSIAENWQKLNLTERIRDDSEQKKLGYKFRDEMSDTMHIVGYKFASLFLRMCGYDYIAPMDKWAERFGTAHGFVNPWPNTGLKKKEHIACEKVLARYAKKHDASLALFQATIYARFSSWKKDSKVDNLGNLVIHYY